MAEVMPRTDVRSYNWLPNPTKNRAESQSRSQRSRSGEALAPKSCLSSDDYVTIRLKTCRCFCHTLKLCDDTNDRSSELGAKNLVMWHKREAKWYNCDPTVIQCDEKWQGSKASETKLQSVADRTGALQNWDKTNEAEDYVRQYILYTNETI